MPVRIASVCWPKVGGAVSWFKGVAENFIGLDIIGALPPSGWGRSKRTPRALTCSSSKAWAMVLIGPLGTPASSRIATHSLVVLCANTSLSIGTRTPRFCTRPAFLAKRSSVTKCLQPAAAQNLAYRLSLPHARMTLPSLVGNTW